MTKMEWRFCWHTGHPSAQGYLLNWPRSIVLPWSIVLEDFHINAESSSPFICCSLGIHSHHEKHGSVSNYSIFNSNHTAGNTLDLVFVADSWMRGVQMLLLSWMEHYLIEFRFAAAAELCSTSGLLVGSSLENDGFQ